jgi:hypothetical protein
MRSRKLEELSEAKTLAILDKFEQWGRDHARTSWSEALRRLAPLYVLTTHDLEPVDRAAARVLVRAKNVFERARRASRGKAEEVRGLRQLAKNPRKAPTAMPAKRKTAS